MTASSLGDCDLKVDYMYESRNIAQSGALVQLREEIPKASHTQLIVSIHLIKTTQEVRIYKVIPYHSP